MDQEETVEWREYTEEDRRKFEELLEAEREGRKPHTSNDGLSWTINVEKTMEAFCKAQAEAGITSESIAAGLHDDEFSCDTDYDYETEIIWHEPILTPYDKALFNLRRAQAKRDSASEGSAEWHRAMSDLANAQREFKLEQWRSTDDEWRKRRETDEWRKKEGREEYNQSRRKIRDKPNNMTPRELLNAMSDEERMQHKKDKNAEKNWVHKRRKAGWSEERIEAERPGWWEKRLKKRHEVT